MIAQAEQELTKVCRVCWTRLPITKFRRMSIAKGTYHPKCRDCRRELARVEKLGERKSSISRFCRVAGVLKTPEALLKFVDRYCDEMKTTPFDLANELAKFSLSDDCTPSQRIKITRALLHINATAELAKAEAQPKLDDPNAVIRELHRTHQLFPTLREMYLEGKLGFDDLDPPPDFAGPGDDE